MITIYISGDQLTFVSLVAKIYLSLVANRQQLIVIVTDR